MPEGVAVQREAFDLDEATRAMVDRAGGQAGAVATFTGVVRADALGGGRVEALEYEAYEEMALSQLAAVRTAAVERFGLLDARIVHRVGTLPVGHASVYVIAAAPHRREALAAVAWIMDEVKRTVPVWKRERGGDEAQWVQGEHATRPAPRLPFG